MIVSPQTEQTSSGHFGLDAFGIRNPAIAPSRASHSAIPQQMCSQVYCPRATVQGIAAIFWHVCLRLSLVRIAAQVRMLLEHIHFAGSLCSGAGNGNTAAYPPLPLSVIARDRCPPAGRSAPRRSGPSWAASSPDAYAFALPAVSHVEPLTLSHCSATPPTRSAHFCLSRHSAARVLGCPVSSPACLRASVPTCLNHKFLPSKILHIFWRPRFSALFNQKPAPPPIYIEELVFSSMPLPLGEDQGEGAYPHRGTCFSPPPPRAFGIQATRSFSIEYRRHVSARCPTMFQRVPQCSIANAHGLPSMGTTVSPSGTKRQSCSAQDLLGGRFNKLAHAS